MRKHILRSNCHTRLIILLGFIWNPIILCRQFRWSTCLGQVRKHTPPSPFHYGNLGMPRPDIKNKMQKVFIRRFPLRRFLAKALKINKNYHEKNKNICRSHSTLNSKSRGSFDAIKKRYGSLEYIQKKSSS